MRVTIATIIIVATWMPAAAVDNTEGLVEALCKLTTQPTTTAMKELGTVEQLRGVQRCCALWCDRSVGAEINPICDHRQGAIRPSNRQGPTHSDFGFSKRCSIVLLKSDEFVLAHH